MDHPLKIFRLSRDLSLDAMAAKLGVSKTSVSRIENSKQDCSSDLLRKIAEVTEGVVLPNDIVLIAPILDTDSVVHSEAAA